MKNCIQLVKGGFFLGAAALMAAGTSPYAQTVNRSSTALASDKLSHTDIVSPDCPPEFIKSLDANSVHRSNVRLIFVACSAIGQGALVPFVSPDGKWALRSDADNSSRIRIASLRESGRFNHSLGSTLIYATPFYLGGPQPIMWSTHSLSIWATQQIAEQSKEFSSKLVPIILNLDGTVTSLPALKEAAGRLDTIMWVGPNGLALGGFNGISDHSQGTPASRSPRIGIVDAVRGTVRDILIVDKYPELKARLQNSGLKIVGATATVLPSGQVKAVLQFNPYADRLRTASSNHHSATWLTWAEGRTPKLWPSPYPDEVAVRSQLTPDGSFLLVARPLQPTPIAVSDCRGCPPLSSPAITGTVAEFLDVETGRSLWQITSSVDRNWDQSASPVISADGKFALIEFPPQDHFQTIGLINLRTGELVLRFPTVMEGAAPPRFDFFPDGKRIWVTSGNIFFQYELNLP